MQLGKIRIYSAQFFLEIESDRIDMSIFYRIMRKRHVHCACAMQSTGSIFLYIKYQRKEWRAFMTL